MSHRAWMYHPTEAPKGRIFEGEALESLGEGWVDTPDKFDEPAQTVEEKTEAAVPLPENFDTVDDFMEAFVEASDLPEEKRDRDSALKAGLEQYLLAKHKSTIDRRKSIESITEQARELDERVSTDAA